MILRIMTDLSLNSTQTLQNEVKIPILGLGTWQASGEKLRSAIIEALNLGYRHIDTAEFYKNEKEVGDAIASSDVPREEIFVTTKLWYSNHGNKKALKACNESLKRMNLDYVDLYLIHWPKPIKRVETWKALETLYEEGLAKSIGVSNYMVPHLQEVLDNCKITPMVNQIEFHPFIYSERKAIEEFCTQNNIAIEAYSPLVRAEKFGHSLIQRLADKYQKSYSQILLRWGLQHDAITIPKSTTPKHIKENSEIFDFSINEKDMNQMDNIQEYHRVTTWNPLSKEWF